MRGKIQKQEGETKEHRDSAQEKEWLILRERLYLLLL